MTAREQRTRLRSLRSQYPGLSDAELLEFDTGQEVPIEFDWKPSQQKDSVGTNRAVTPFDLTMINSIELCDRGEEP